MTVCSGPFGSAGKRNVGFYSIGLANLIKFRNVTNVGGEFCAPQNTIVRAKIDVTTQYVSSQHHTIIIPNRFYLELWKS